MSLIAARGGRSHVHDVARARPAVSPPGPTHDQPPARVDAGRAAEQRLAAGQLDPHVAADGDAGGGVRRPQAASASAPPSCQAS